MAQPIPPSSARYAQALLQTGPSSEPPRIQSTITTLALQTHIEGGYFVETDRDHLLVPNPFHDLPVLDNPTVRSRSDSRNASTTIFYLLGQASPVGYFHRNRGRTVHTLHRGRGRYVLLHFDERKAPGDKVRVETFVVGQDVEHGEKLQWIVDGGKFKASFLLPDDDDNAAADVEGEDGQVKLGSSEGGLLISETVVPGFEFSDHDFMTAEQMADALEPAQVQQLRWLLKKGEQAKLDGVLERQGR